MGWACETAQTSKVEAVEALAKRVDTRGVAEGAVFLFNSLPWPRKALIEYHTERNPGRAPVPITHLATKEGKKIPIQWRGSDSMTNFFPRLSAWVDLLPCGYRVLELVHGTPPDPEPYHDFFAISDRGFGISSLKSPDGKELLAGPLGLVVISDTSDTWAYEVAKFRQEIARPMLVSSEQIEESPVLGLNYKSQIKPWEIKTLMVERARGQRAEIKEVSLLER